MKNADDLILIGKGFYQQQYAIALPKESNLTGQLNQALVALQSDARGCTSIGSTPTLGRGRFRRWSWCR
jgi:ABC-type amino acid transport substrate-binding protein